MTELNVHASNIGVSTGFSSFLNTIEVDPTPQYQKYDVPEYAGFKSYMPYTLFSKKSNQYALQNLCKTDSYGFRKVDDYYVVALGTAFPAKIGQRLDLILANDQVIQCVLGDVKSDKDTDKSHIFSSNRCMSEFLIDPISLESNMKKMGDISYHPNNDWNSPVVTVRIYEENVLNS